MRVPRLIYRELNGIDKPVAGREGENLNLDVECAGVEWSDVGGRGEELCCTAYTESAFGGDALHRVVMCCTVFCCVVFKYCTVLDYIVLYCRTLRHTVLRSMLYCTALHCTVPYCNVLCSTALSCRTAQHLTLPTALISLSNPYHFAQSVSPLYLLSTPLTVRTCRWL
jgi:hypothetical protein